MEQISTAQKRPFLEGFGWSRSGVRFRKDQIKEQYKRKTLNLEAITNQRLKMNITNIR